jgi:hypothetical protein
LFTSNGCGSAFKFNACTMQKSYCLDKVQSKYSFIHGHTSPCPCRTLCSGWQYLKSMLAGSLAARCADAIRAELGGRIRRIEPDDGQSCFFVVQVEGA